MSDDIRNRREQLGLSQAQLAQMVGTTQQTIDRIERGQVAFSRALPALYEALGLEPKSPPVVPKGTGPRLTIAQPSTRIPVFGTVEAGSGAMILSSDPVENLDLFRSPGAFGLYVAGESMFPVFRAGDIVIVRPQIPPRREDPVVLTDIDGASAMLKEYLGQTETHWRLRQYGDEPREFEVPKANWPTIQLVGARLTRR